MVGKVTGNTIELIIYVRRFRNGSYSSRVYCIFAQSTNKNVWITNCSSHGWITNLQHCDWLVTRNYNTHVMSKDPHSCIKLNKNMDNELYCISNAFPTIPVYKLWLYTITIKQLLNYIRIIKTRRRSRIDLNFATPVPLPFSFVHFGKSFQTEAAE